MKKENLTFGIIWGAVSFLVGILLIKVIDIIRMIIDYLVDGVLYIIMFPAKLVQMIGISNALLGLLAAVGIGIVLAPFIKKVYDWLMRIIRGSPL